LYQLGVRYYDPMEGRFISLDPLRANPQDPMTLYRYLYAKNDPVRLIDPSGLKVGPYDTWLQCHAAEMSICMDEVAPPDVDPSVDALCDTLTEQCKSWGEYAEACQLVVDVACVGGEIGAYDIAGIFCAWQAGVICNLMKPCRPR